MPRERKELLSGLPMKRILNDVLAASAPGHWRIRSLNGSMIQGKDASLGIRET